MRYYENDEFKISKWIDNLSDKQLNKLIMLLDKTREIRRKINRIIFGVKKKKISPHIISFGDKSN